jgi:hypothetical protein
MPTTKSRGHRGINGEVDLNSDPCLTPRCV